MKRRRPPPTSAQSPYAAPLLGDAALLELLLARGVLSQEQTEAFVGFSVKLATGQLQRLPKTVRDHGMSLAKVQGLLRSTAARPQKAKALGLDGGDNFSTRPGPVDPRAAAQFGVIPKPVKRSA